MKTLILTAVFVSFSVLSFAQCDKKATLKSLTGRFVQDGTRQDEMPFEATITINTEKIILATSAGGPSLTIANTINEVVTCQWKEFLKNGTTIYKVSTDKGNGVPEPSVIKLSSKDGKTTIYFGSDPDDKGGLELDISESRIEQ